MIITVNVIVKSLSFIRVLTVKNLSHVISRISNVRIMVKSLEQNTTIAVIVNVHIPYTKDLVAQIIFLVG